MNLIEALRSGKKFKRSHWQIWHQCDAHYCNDTYKREEVLAEDYEIQKEEKIEISRAQFEVAFKATANHLEAWGITASNTFQEILSKNLGFKE